MATDETWVRSGRPERVDVAEALGWPHRYRGGLIMLMVKPLATHPDGVIYTKSLSVEGATAMYTCWLSDANLIVLSEGEIVAPDEAGLRDALAAAGPAASRESWSHLFDVLRTSYVWLMADPSTLTGERSSESLLMSLYHNGLASDKFRSMAPSPVQVFTDLERANESYGSRGRHGIAARVPFVVACRIARVLGNSEGIIINPGLQPFGALGRDTYPFIPGSVVGYDIMLRPLPRAGLDPDWLEPLRTAVQEHQEVKAAYAWCRATAPDGDLLAATTNCLGLTLDEGLDDAAFDRVRVEIRERAVSLGLSPGPYAVTTVRPGAPHASDTVNVVRLA